MRLIVMKKYGLFVVCLLIACVVLCACKIESNNSMVKSQRRLQKYLTPPQTPAGVVDSSEAPKLRYNANFGPKDLNFDIKLENPYH